MTSEKSSKKTTKTSRTKTTKKSKDKSLSSKSKGLGDTVEKVTKATGIKKLVKFVAGEDCGCDERKEKLNKIFPYARPKCLTESEYNFLKPFFPVKRAEYTRAEVNGLIDIHNRIGVGRVYKRGTNCGSCVKDVLKNLEKVYNEYAQ